MMHGILAVIAQIAATVVSALRVQDLFSTTLFTGNAASRTITTGVSSTAAAALIWIKSRSSRAHTLFDTKRGVGLSLCSNNTALALGTATTLLTAFGAAGFTLDNNAAVNASGENYVAWSFRAAPKFFDVITYTGNGANRTISHALGIAPGLIIVKRTSGAVGGWYVKHKDLGTSHLRLDLNDAPASSPTTTFGTTTPTTTGFDLPSGSDLNINGAQYVAYLFAHDAASDGKVQCGTLTTDEFGDGTATLGWAPQFLLMKVTAGATDDWYMVDTTRGWVSNSVLNILNSNLVNAETIGDYFFLRPTSTGLTVNGGYNSAAFVFMAIRAAS